MALLTIQIQHLNSHLLSLKSRPNLLINDPLVHWSEPTFTQKTTQREVMSNRPHLRQSKHIKVWRNARTTQPLQRPSFQSNIPGAGMPETAGKRIFPRTLLQTHDQIMRCVSAMQMGLASQAYKTSLKAKELKNKVIQNQLPCWVIFVIEFFGLSSPDGCGIYTESGCGSLV